ncbi:TonB family protein [Pontibacter pamirensis]|uniref:TonB family protein n=1 Tax=Pontibacter pamirensis TaxID=2562824 RepID=UPI0013894FB8|nr:TonB family protein [Pontibacter pamirensis]
MKNILPFSCLAGIVLLGSTTIITPEALAQAGDSEEKVYSYVEQMPTFAGGDTEMMNFITSNIRYPQDAREAGVEGFVIVSFVVETNGSVTHIDTVKGLSASTDAEAKRLAGLTAGKWTTGRQNGKPIRVKYTLPVRFSMDKEGNPAVLHKMPQFRGGQEAMVRTIYQHLKMPAAAQQENISARMQVNFNIEEDGKVSNIAIANTKLKHVVGAGADMDYMDASTFKLQNKTVLAEFSKAAAEAIQATSGMWEAGTRHGKPIVAEVTLPVLFSGAGETDTEQNLETMLLTYQSDAYDSKFSYKADEVDVRPALQDGAVDKFLAKHLRYPDTSFEGTIKVAFFVTQDGRLIGPKTNVSEEVAIADEIARVFELTEGNWIPAKKNSQPITAIQEITVAFVTKDSKKKSSASAAIPANVVVTRNK